MPNNKRTKSGESLWETLQNGSLADVEALLSGAGGLDVNDPKHTPGDLLPLHFACEKNQPALVKVLLAHKADINAVDLGETMTTALQVACENKAFECARILLDSKADVTVAAADYSTPLHWAVTHNELPVVQLLVSGGSDVNARSSDDQTPLGCAIHHNAIESAMLLIEKGAIASSRDSQHVSLLHMAAHTGDVAIGKKVLSAGVNPNSLDKHDMTALHWAGCRAHSSFASLLLSTKVDASLPDKMGCLALHYACNHSDPACATLLVNKEAVNTTDKHGRTPLHWACNQASPDIVKLLIEGGAVAVEDMAGQTPADLAKLQVQQHQPTFNTPCFGTDSAKEDLLKFGQASECVQLLNNHSAPSSGDSITGGKLEDLATSYVQLSKKGDGKKCAQLFAEGGSVHENGKLVSGKTKLQALHSKPRFGTVALGNIMVSSSASCVAVELLGGGGSQMVLIKTHDSALIKEVQVFALS